MKCLLREELHVVVGVVLHEFAHHHTESVFDVQLSLNSWMHLLYCFRDIHSDVRYLILLKRDYNWDEHAADDVRRDH